MSVLRQFLEQGIVERRHGTGTQTTALRPTKSVPTVSCKKYHDRLHASKEKSGFARERDIRKVHENNNSHQYRGLNPASPELLQMILGKY